MNDRFRQALAWLAAAAIVFIGLLLLFSAASPANGTPDPARQDLNWPALQTIVAFVLFDLALLVGLLIARLRSRPTSLSPKALLATAAIAALLALAILVVALDWPLNLSDLIWTFVLIAGFGLLLALGMVWLAFRRGKAPKPVQPAHEADSLPPAETAAESRDPILDDTLPESEADTQPKPDDADPLAYLTTLVGGDQEAAERLVAMQQTLDPGASHRESIARAVYQLVRDRV
jgi:hypothetical protein